MVEKVVKTIKRLRERVGEFWWYSLLMFVASRSGDLVQAFVGLWLVPHYVPQSELGAVLPLVQMASVLGLPVAILVTPFMRFLNVYATSGQYGKLKRLLQVAFFGAIIAFVVTFFLSRWLLPLFFERLRIPPGLLGVLIICLGLMISVSPIFYTSLQALKKFNEMFIVGVLTAPIRLIVLLITMPIRALSGYMLGQMVAPLLNVGCAFWGLRKELGRSVKAEPFLREDWKPMLRYTWPIAVNTIIGTMFIGWQALLIRQRLPDVDSAAYYMISRLAEIACYAGMSLAAAMFPLAVESDVQKRSGNRLLRNLLMGTLLSALAVAAVYAIFGKMIFRLVPLWSAYEAYVPQLVLLTIVLGLKQMAGNFCSFEMAQSRFGCLLWMLPATVIETSILIVLTGSDALSGWLSNSTIDWMKSLHTARLDFFLWWFFAVAVLECVFVLMQIIVRRRATN